jgi:hypothetical protein
MAVCRSWTVGRDLLVIRYAAAPIPPDARPPGNGKPAVARTNGGFGGLRKSVEPSLARLDLAAKNDPCLDVIHTREEVQP